MRADCGERIAELAQQSGAYTGSNTNWSPASSGLTEQTKTPLILEHQPHMKTPLSLAFDLLTHHSAEFF